MADFEGYFWVYLCDEYVDGWVLVKKEVQR